MGTILGVSHCVLQEAKQGLRNYHYLLTIVVLSPWQDQGIQGQPTSHVTLCSDSVTLIQAGLTTPNSGPSLEVGILSSIAENPP